MSSESELDAIRRKKLQELQMQLAAEQQRTEQQQAVEASKKAVLRQILTTEARQRLSRIKLVKPTYAEQLELQLIQAAQTRRIKIPITALHRYLCSQLSFSILETSWLAHPTSSTLSLGLTSCRISLVLSSILTS